MNEMKAKSSLLTILFLLGLLSPNLFAAEEQAGDGCNVDISDSLPAHNLLNSEAGVVVETVLADSCAEEHLNSNPAKYAAYCECNKVSPTADDEERFNKFMKNRKGLEKALAEKGELESSGATTSYLLFDALSKLKDNSIAYPETCSELLKAEDQQYQSCMSGDRLKDLQSISGLTDPNQIFKRIVPKGNESFYRDSTFDIMSFYGFGGNENRRLDFNLTMNPSMEKVNEVLEGNPQFSVAEEIIGPAVGKVLDKYDVKLSELFHNEEYSDQPEMLNMVSGNISRQFITNTYLGNDAKVLLAVAHEYFGEGPFNPNSLDVTVKLRVKAMEHAIKKNRKGSDVLEEAITSGQYLRSPIFLNAYLKNMIGQVKEKLDPDNKKTDQEISELLKDKKITEVLSEDERKSLYKQTFSEMIFKVIKNFKNLGSLCSSYRANFNKVCGDNSFEEETWDGADFINHAMAFNPKGTGVKIMCEKAFRHLKDESDGTDGAEVALDEKGFLGYLQHLGGVTYQSPGGEGESPVLTRRERPVMGTGHYTPNREIGTNNIPDSSYDMYRGVPVTSTSRVAPDSNSPEGGTPVGGNGGPVNYEITNFTSPDSNRRVLVDAIIKNDEKEIREVLSSKFADDMRPQPVFAKPGKQDNAGFFDTLENEVKPDQAIEDFMARNFALYDDNDSAASTADTSVDPNIFNDAKNDSGIFSAQNIPTRTVDFDELSDEEKKEYNETMSELDEKIDEGEKLAENGEKKLEKTEDDEEKLALQKQLDDLRKSIQDLKEQKENLANSVAQGAEDIRANLNQPATPKRQPASFEDKKYVSKVPSSTYRPASVKRKTPNFSTGSSFAGGGSGSYSGGSVNTPVAYVDGTAGYDGTIVTNGNAVGKSQTTKNPGPKLTASDAINFDKVILERTSTVLAPDVFSSYGQEQFEQYYRDHGTDPIVVKKQIEIVVGDKKETKDVYVYYFPEMKDGKINYVKRDPAAVISALRTVKSKKKVDEDLELIRRDIASHNELIKLFKQVID